MIKSTDLSFHGDIKSLVEEELSEELPEEEVYPESEFQDVQEESLEEE